MRTETLYCKEGTADKQYTITMSPSGGGFVVVCFNGRRGGMQAQQIKTPAPVTQAEAEKLYERIRREKLAKGYHSGADAPVMAAPPSDFAAGIAAASNPYRPMLLNSIGPAEAEKLLSDPDWFMQQKADGVRAIVQVSCWEQHVSAASRTGKPVVLTVEVSNALLTQFGGTDVILDCESCGPVLVIFDLLSIGVDDLRGLGNDVRVGRLERLAVNAPSCLSFIQTARTETEKRAALKILRDGGAEGVVFKNRTAKYSVGRPSSGGNSLKWKFVASASVVVTSQHRNGKRSVTIALADGAEVGAVTIPPNHEVPALGSVIEVEYLYAHRGGSLTQPIYKGVRFDVEPDTADTLQYKGEERSEDMPGLEASAKEYEEQEKEKSE